MAAGPFAASRFFGINVVGTARDGNAMTVNVTDVGQVRVVEIDRPEVRNAVNTETADRLRDAFRDFSADDSAKVAVLTGSNGHFCAGYDLKALSGRSLEDIYEPEGEGPMGPSRMQLDKPVIAAVEGYAVAGGIELAAWCDMRIASHTAVFGVFCRRWGVPLIDGGTIRLPRLIGMSRAMDMILTGRPVDAQEAFAWGLANRLVPAGKALDQATELADEIAAFPELCMKTDRASAYHQWGASLEEALRFEGVEGLKPLQAEAVAGAGRFAGGKGRGGKFDDI